MLKYFLFTCSLLTAVFNTSAFASFCEEQLNSVASKFNFSLERTFAEAQNAGTKLDSVFILGAIKINAAIDSEEEILGLFQDKNTVVRSIIHAGVANIVTFSSSLAGVQNAACSRDVLSVQMSQKLGGTAGMTVRN